MSVYSSQGALRIGTLGAARITPMALVSIHVHMYFLFLFLFLFYFDLPQIYPAEKLGDVEVVAVAARDYEQAKKFAAKHK